MAIIVQDTFNRADDPASLGNADTGQTWSQSVGASCAFGVVSSQAKFNAPSFLATNGGSAWIDAGTEDAIVKATLVNVQSLPGFVAFVGVTARRESSSRLYRLVVRNNNPIGAPILTLEYVLSAGVFNSLGAVEITPQNGDTIALALCGVNFAVFLNDVEQFSGSSAILNIHGTSWGLTTNQGTVPAIYSQSFDDFLITTNGTCTPTYNCTPFGCVDPGDGSGTYATLEACLTACEIAESYNCVDGTCVDPGDGTGEFSTLLECQQSGCANLQAETQKFDAGNGSEWMLLAQLSDSGDELRSKNIKAGYVVGKVTNADFTIYPVDVGQSIDVEAMEAGTRTAGATRPQFLPDTDGVAQSPRKQVNVINAITHTVRVSGNDTGEEVRDRIDQITYEVDQQGCRR